MSVGQLERSALRRALQSCFIKSTLEILHHSHRRGKLDTRFEASWKWALTISALLQQGISDDSEPSLIRDAALELNIHGGSTRRHSHQRLFKAPGVQTVPNRAIELGLSKLSNQALLAACPKDIRNSMEFPWKFVLPEDIGSCFEIVKEMRVTEREGVIQLEYDHDRRNAGAHHTPYDVTEHMVKTSVKKLESSTDQIQGVLVCDIAVGAGAMLVQAARQLAEILQKSVADVLKSHVVGFDLDATVLRICSLVFHLQCDCPDDESEYNLHALDSVGKRNSKHRLTTLLAELNDSTERRPMITIGNPPYVRVKTDFAINTDLTSRRCGNLSALFLEQAMRLSANGDVVSQVVPLSMIQAGRMKQIREVLFQESSEIQIEAFDCVPGYLFDQGKVGNNSNTAITQRVAIITAVRGVRQQPRITTTRFLRWGSKERDVLFHELDLYEIPYELCQHQIPLLGNKHACDVLKEIKKTNRVLDDLIHQDSKECLYIPKAVRYFCTASRVDLQRSQIRICFPDRMHRDVAHIVINSSMFYWFWRLYGNGFQVTIDVLKQIPMPSQRSIHSFASEIQAMSDVLHASRDRLAVSKSNKGQIANIKYDLDEDLMGALDALICKIFDLRKPYPFKAAKENSLAGYASHFDGRII